MFEGFSKFFKELDRRIKVTIIGMGIHNWSQRLTNQYKQLYAKGLGATAVELGLLNSIGSAVSSTFSLPLGWVAEKYGVKKVMLFTLLCAFISATIYALAGNWLILIPAVILAGFSVRMMPLTDIIFITSSKPQQRATVMSLSRVIWGILNIFAPMIAAVIVTTFGGINAEGIRPLYYIQLVLGISVLLFITLKLQPLPHIDQKKDDLSSRRGGFIQDFRDLFEGEKGLKRWVAIRIIRQFAMSLSISFIPLWKVDVKGATPYILGIMGTASVIIMLILQIPVGRLSDRIGRKKAYFLLRPISYLSTILLIIAPKPEYLIVVGFLEGIKQVSNMPFITMHWEMVPKEKRGRWFGVEGLMNFAKIPSTILGGILWQQGFMLEVLLLPIILEAILVIPILITVPDTLGRSNR